MVWYNFFSRFEIGITFVLILPELDKVGHAFRSRYCLSKNSHVCLLTSTKIMFDSYAWESTVAGSAAVRYASSELSGSVAGTAVRSLGGGSTTGDGPGAVDCQWRFEFALGLRLEAHVPISGRFAVRRGSELDSFVAERGREENE